MSRRIGVSLAVGCALFLVAGTASAQGLPPSLYNRPTYGPGNRPQLNPYLNLNRNNDPAVNYFLGTLPEFDRRATKQLYGSALANLEDRALLPPAPAGSDVDLFIPLPTTGHPTAFQNTAGYFPSTPLRPSQGYTPPRR